MSKQLKVVYIIGAVRSGSTILDTVLGNHQDVQSVGELGYAARALTSESEFCSCGKLAAECPFWSEVQREWTTLWPERPTLEGWSRLQAQYEQPSKLPNLIFGIKTSMPASFANYLRGVETLYQAISRVSGKRFIVDSSKNPVRGLAISQSPTIDLKLIHLVRDCRGVIWSRHKEVERDPRNGVERHISPKPAWRTTLAWYATNRIAEYATKINSSENSLLVRYEDFASQPERQLERISVLTGINFSQVSGDLVRNKPLQSDHTIAGNRLRMEQEIRLKPDFTWQGRLSKTQTLAFKLIAQNTARRYGFPDL